MNVWLIAMLGCDGSEPGDSPRVLESPTESRTDSEPPDVRWTGTVTVDVVDPDGAPVPDAFVLLGGWDRERWVPTDSAGQATVEVDDDGVTDRVLVAGKEGWISGRTDLPESEPGTATIEMRPLPTEDNPDYAFQKGGEPHSPDTGECGHCHTGITEGWAGSAHSQAASSPQLWDLYTGRASVDAAECDALGGELADGQVAGEDGATAEACYLGEGVLPWLNDCTNCDHPDERAALTAFGSCGDCHSPATDAGVPGQIDVADAFGVAHEGVTCDFCHKVQSVTAGPEAGLDGGIQLLRPSEEPRIGGQEFDPIMFGPYPDVVVPVMNGSYNPVFREPEFCASCHEYAQPALHPDESVDAERFPDGLPVLETWSEFQAAGADEAGFSCQGCHMPTLEQESSTYDISDLGVPPSLVQGWLRTPGEVRHHHFPTAAELGDPHLELEGAASGATMSLTSRAAHRVPTGDPMRQLFVLMSAVDSAGEPVQLVGAPAIADVGGSLASGVMGEVTVEGDVLSLSASGAVSARFVRDEAFLAEVAVTAHPDGVQLASVPDLLAGDVVLLVGPDHHAGAPGWLFSKILVDSSGARGVAHYRAVDIASDNRLPAFSTVDSAMALPDGVATLTATLLRRSHAAPIADVYGWDYGDRVASSASMSVSE
ncbi:MAG: hypothetical protein GY913_35895 [Proteobacteria bacterium]|nr:hypothetical protein [Pseudomonadota bacterium]MCP4922314.1 hypothetical protein [Pseudomonadota bacterium]